MRSLEWLNQASEDDFVATLANVFEHSPWIAKNVHKNVPFTSLTELRDSLMLASANISAERRLAFIRAHPDLANTLQRSEGLTADSIAEQDGAGLDQLSNDELVSFQELNTAYKEKFGFPFILCVKRHTKDSILDEFSRRLKNSPEVEVDAAFSEIRRIATLRLVQLVSGADQLPVYGTLSIAVADMTTGAPAEGIAIDLIELSRRGADRRIAKITTNTTGGADQPLVQGRPVPIGTYQFEITAGDYFRRAGVVPSGQDLFRVIPVRFQIVDPERYQRISLRIAPSGYAVGHDHRIE